MPVIMVYSSHSSSSHRIRMYREHYPDLFLAQLGEGVFLMRNNGLSLALASKLTKTFGGMIDIHVAERLTGSYIPEKVKKVAEYLAEHERGCSLETAIRKCGFTVEEIECQKVESRITLREK